MYSKKATIAKEFIARLDKVSGEVLIFVHLSVDGDCIGAGCGLSEVLNNLGYKTRVAVCEEIPANMRFLGVEDYTVRLDGKCDPAPELVIAVDCAEGARMGANGVIFDSCDNKLIVDHHKSVTIEADNYWIVPEASSASELVYYLALELIALKGREVKDVITSKAANFIMAGMVTDTGRFAYANTRPETLKTAGELMVLGAEISPIMYWFFDSKDASQLLICSLGASEARFDHGGKIASTIVTNEMFDRCNDPHSDIGEIVARLRNVVGVRLAIVLREQEDGAIRVNFRSFEPFDSAEFAANYGGGGHQNAAGATVRGREINELRDEMVKRASELI